MMNRNLFFTVLGAVALVLCLLGIGGFYEILATGPVALLREPVETRVEAAMFVPRQAPLMTSLLVNVDKLENVGRLAVAPKLRGQVREEFDKIKKGVLANTDLNYHKDIEPWLGDEITFAVTSSDFDREQGNGRQAGYLLAVETKSPQRSRDFLEVLWSQNASNGVEVAVENYQGVKLIYRQTPSNADSGGNWASAVVGDRFVLFANHPKVLRDAINNVQAQNLNLKGNPAYQEAVANMASTGIGLSFINVEQFTAWISDRPGETGLKPPSERVLAAENSPSLGIALGLNRQGLLAHTIWNGTTSTEWATSLPSLLGPVQALQYLPSQTAFTIAGADLNHLWLALEEGFPESGAVGQILRKPVATVRSRWGLDLPEAIFNWVQGEYAIGLLPQTPVENEANPGFAWIFVAQKSGETALKGIEQLDAIAQEQGFSVGPVSWGNRPISTWTKLTTKPVPTKAKGTKPLQIAADVRAVHTEIGAYEIFASSLETLTAAIDAPTTGSIVSNPGFQSAIAPLPQSNYGYFYLDWLASEESLTRRFPVLRLVTLAGKPLFQRLQSISLSSPAPGIDPGIDLQPVKGSPLADLFIRLGS
ncbi:DUF3352 domain-containing protein [Laspinema olomoucense]|uniref:DUF3352 domain-containing protein n=1 Tax=Laspinema olomoucense TaxID=3231600 RepID=UPI0021BA75DA|nr:DUF3352 domain-containing protein [Laspinema sp. D3a]MCT7990157.1 DUF3352 domain-containing protein [Laspinema sp. D3a]